MGEINTNYVYAHVEIGYRKILRKKILGIFPVYNKIPVFKLIYEKPLGIAGESYEEYNSHKDIYVRLANEPIYGQQFPSCISINEFIDLGFKITFK